MTHEPLSVSRHQSKRNGPSQRSPPKENYTKGIDQWAKDYGDDEEGHDHEDKHT